MSPVASLVVELLTIVAILLIWRGFASSIEKICADRGWEDLYRRFNGVLPYLIIVATVWSVVGFVLTLVLKGIAK